MKKYLLIATLLLPSLAFSEEAGGGVASQTRDASAAFIATQNYIVGRLGRVCLEELKRSDDPADYLKKWQRDNAKYYDSANKYMDARLKEIPDDEERDAVQSSYYSAVNSKGEAAVDQVLGRSSKTESCKYAITLIDAGSMNIEDFVKSAKLPIMPNLEELVAWASAH